MSVAVVIPAWNGSSFIGRTIESVLWQTLPPDEFVVVDDHSTDDTIAAIAAVDPGVRVIPNSGRGSNPARATGAAATDAKYLAFLDHDDIWFPHHLEVMVGLLDSNPDMALAYSKPRAFTDEPAIAPATPEEAEVVHLWDTFPYNHVGGPSPVVMRRSALDAIGGWPTWDRVPTDVYLWFRLADIGPFAHWPAPTSGWRSHDGSLSATRRRRDPAGYEGRRLELLTEALDLHQALDADNQAPPAALSQYALLVDLFEVVFSGDPSRLTRVLGDLEATGEIRGHLVRYFRANLSPEFVGHAEGLRSLLTVMAAWPHEHRALRRGLIDPVVAKAALSGVRDRPLSPRQWELPATLDLRLAAAPVMRKVVRGVGRRGLSLAGRATGVR